MADLTATILGGAALFQVETKELRKHADEAWIAFGQIRKWLWSGMFEDDSLHDEGTAWQRSASPGQRM